MDHTVLMIHGMWGGAWCWDDFRPWFERKGYRCVAPTLPWHDMEPDADPDPRLGTASLLDYASFLEQEISKLDEKPVLMGHSMGGLLAQMLAARGRGSALVLLTPASPAGIRALTPSTVWTFLPAQMTWGFWRKPMRLPFRNVRWAILNGVPEDEQKAIYDRFVYESGRAACEIGYWFLDPNRASHIDASKVTCPVLVIAGGRDRITPSPIVRRVARKYEAVATFREFEDRAHWITGEPGWQEVAEYVDEWLTSVKA